MALYVQNVQINTCTQHEFCGKSNEFYHRQKPAVMAPIELQPVYSPKSKRKPHSALRIDMTPMVDLGFLLITFFIFTTTMSQKKVMKLFVPKAGPPIFLGASKALTVLLGQNNKIFAYEGKFEDALKQNSIISTSYDESNGLGDLIRHKQKQLEQTDKKEGRDGLVLLIKPTAASSYKNFVDAMDETVINDVKKYVVVAASEEEKVQLQKITQ